MALNPTGTLLFVASAYPPSSVSVFSVDTRSGKLAPVNGSPFATGADTEPYDIAVDPGGAFVYTANHRSNNISAFRITPATGRLTPVPGSPFAAGEQPSGLAIRE